MHIKEELIYYLELANFHNNKKIVKNLLSQNPKNLSVYKDGFAIYYGDLEVRWFLDFLKENIIKLSINLNKSSKIKNNLL